MWGSVSCILVSDAEVSIFFLDFMLYLRTLKFLGIADKMKSVRLAYIFSSEQGDKSDA